MKIASAVSAVLASLAPSVFAQDHHRDVGAGIPAVDYHYGMELDVQRVLYRTDATQRAGVVPVTMVYEDSQGDLHKVRFLEWGSHTSNS
ncbi:DUF2790 domain-containing protein [Pseudomonas sp. JS3066]|jgi:hypothetical protein|uniref:DUF2790 domain-containing protein n=1 Tax=unclassified Pseudomonas TaxID=196821 RepID=UPI000EA95751|nr:MULTISPECIES: DUF2790 domain-containing protein [unclassified Pseudomonas]AYF87732.1 DUF2790 domain-containing protein [Pseudomonas sp. DY-1]MDH4655511.1 DUF2790 domain-containing protein [Pseudomonas sp. BN606]MRK19986.1 DUF2790 domain-containing protein [Pseudomonas sp. JG-B]WVK94705.1 DUF2790 domain-containing protein [Pseudomonas sp. JS3066]